MSYRIQYNPEHNNRYPIKQSAGLRTKWLVSAAIAAVLLLGIAGIDDGNFLKSWLLPGDPEVTERALSAMVADIRAGETVGDAVTAFCLEIMEYAQTEP